MSNLILVFLCFSLGYILKRSSRFPLGSAQALNGFIIHISLPALVLHHIHRLTLSWDLFYIALMPWILFFSSFGLFWSLYRFGKISRDTAGALVLTSGFGNTSFVGLPLIQAYYGEEYLGLGILIDQAGTFLCLGTIGILFAFYARDGVFQFRSIGKNILNFPPTQALILAFFLRNWEYPAWLVQILVQLGNTLTPLALVSVGLQLNLREMEGQVSHLVKGLGFKLGLSPLIIYLIYRFGFAIEDEHLKIVVFESAMAPMVTSSIVAMENNLKPELAALILGIGILISFLTTYLVYLLLGV